MVLKSVKDEKRNFNLNKVQIKNKYAEKKIRNKHVLKGNKS